MKVKELIEKLKEMNQELEVMSNNEGGPFEVTEECILEMAYCFEDAVIYDSEEDAKEYVASDDTVIPILYIGE